MSVIFFLIVIGIIVAGGFLVAFIWAVKSGQYDDDYAPSVRILFDNYNSDNNDEIPENQNSTVETEEENSDKSNNNKN